MVMHNIKRYLIWVLLAIFLGLAGWGAYLSIPYIKRFYFFEQIQGKWYPADQDNQSSAKIFSTPVNIVYIKTRPGSLRKRILIIYDTEKRGLLCNPSEILDPNATGRFFCFAVNVSKTDITPDDQSHLITFPMEEFPPLYVDLRLKKRNLDIYIYPLYDDQCIDADNCPFGLFSQLKKNSGLGM